MRASRSFAISKKATVITHSFESGNDGWTLDVGSLYRTQAGSPYKGSWHLTGDVGTRHGTITLQTGAGDVYFWYKSANAGTSFSVDGVVYNYGASPSSGSVYTQVGPIPVLAGTHTFVLTAAYGGYYDYFTFPAP